MPAMRPRPIAASLPQTGRPLLRMRRIYGHFRTDDAAPWLTILVVGHMTVPIVLISEINFQLPMRLALAIYVPLIAGLAAIMLPRCKGVLAALMWAMKAEGSEKI